MAQPSGIGLAQVPSSPTPQSNTLTTIGNALQGTPSSVPSFQDNPLGAIGLILSNAAAGFRGQELPTEKIARNQIAQQQLHLQQLRVTMDAVKQGVEMFSGLDPENPATQEQIGRFSEQFSQILGPGFKDSLTAGLELDRSQGRQALEGLVEHQERIQGICGFSRDCIRNVAGNASLMNQFNTSADQERIPGILQKFQMINEAVGGTPEIAALAEQGYTLAELQQLPEGFDFTPEEIRTISRNEQVQNLLISSGFEPPNLTAEIARATRIAEIQIATTLRTRQPPNLTFQTVEENGQQFLIGLDPKTGAEVSRRPKGPVSSDDLNFQRVRENDQEFILGLDKNTGQVMSRVAAGDAPTTGLSFQTIEEGDEKFLVGLDSETGEEVSRIRQGALIPTEDPELKFQMITEGGNRFLVGVNKTTGQEESRIPAGTEDQPFDSTRLRAGLSLVTNGQPVEGKGLGAVVENIVNGMDPATAATMLGQLQSGGFEIITTEEGTTIRTGAATRMTPGERAEDVRLAKEQAPINAGLANLVGVPTETTTASAREQDINVDIRPAEIERLQAQKTGVQSLIREARQFAELTNDRPELLSLSGAATRSINSLRNIAAGLARSVGFDIRVNSQPATVDELLNADNYADRLQELGVKSAQAQSHYISLAFAAAAAEGQTNRAVSDRDIDRFLLQIGRSADPRASAAVLGNVIGAADVRFLNAVENSTGVRPDSLVEQAQQRARASLEILMQKPMSELTTQDIDRLAADPEGRKHLERLVE